MATIAHEGNETMVTASETNPSRNRLNALPRLMTMPHAEAGYEVG